MPAESLRVPMGLVSWSFGLPLALCITHNTFFTNPLIVPHINPVPCTSRLAHSFTRFCILAFFRHRTICIADLIIRTGISMHPPACHLRVRKSDGFSMPFLARSFVFFFFVPVRKPELGCQLLRRSRCAVF